MQEDNKAASVHRESAEKAAAEGASSATRAVITDLLKNSRKFVKDRFIVNLRDFLAERQPLVWGLALLIGVAVGYAALAFRLSLIHI